MNLSDICQNRVVTIQKSASLREAAKLMAREHIGYLVVVEERKDNVKPIGILTERDLTTASNRDPESLTLENIAALEAMEFPDFPEDQPNY